jgi:hypothetical protein
VKRLKTNPAVAVVAPTAEQLVLAGLAYDDTLRSTEETAAYVAWCVWFSTLLLHCTVYADTGLPFFDSPKDCMSRFADPITMEAGLVLAGLLADRGMLPSPAR